MSGIVRVGLGPQVAAEMRVFAGDVVPRKKPDPAIYLLAAKELGVEPARCVVIEDSHIGLRAAKAAGMRCVVTTSGCDAGRGRERRGCELAVSWWLRADTSLLAQLHRRRGLCGCGRRVRLHRRQGCARRGAARGLMLRAGADAPRLRAGSERFSLHDLTTPGSFWLNPPTPK